MKIGFVSEDFENKTEREEKGYNGKCMSPRKSVVRVYFPSRGMAWSYYNDLFDLSVGDIVYVEGKLEGKRGFVTEVEYNFKIKLSEYKRVIALADTEVRGSLAISDSHFISFERGTIPKGKVRMWFMPPVSEEDEYVNGSDGESFSLDNLSAMHISSDIASAGHNYYIENKVRYICIDGNEGYAIVEGSEFYEIEFNFCDNKVSSLVCSCFCTGACKHQFAAMLQLRDLLECITDNYLDEYKKSKYMAAIEKQVLYGIAVEKRKSGFISL